MQKRETKSIVSLNNLLKSYLLFLCFDAAVTKPLNKGCGLLGLDLNSGWNWQATNHGWVGISTISTI